MNQSAELSYIFGVLFLGAGSWFCWYGFECLYLARFWRGSLAMLAMVMLVAAGMHAILFP